MFTNEWRKRKRQREKESVREINRLTDIQTLQYFQIFCVTCCSPEKSGCYKGKTKQNDNSAIILVEST